MSGQLPSARDIAAQAAAAARVVGSCADNQRVAAITAMAQALRDERGAILDANTKDIAAARDNQIAAAMVDRLALNDDRLMAVAKALDEVASLPAIVGRIDHETTRPNGLVVQRVRIPLGVIAMIYESRPNVTADAASLALRAGNSIILKGGREAWHSNRAIAKAIGAGLEAVGLPRAAVSLVPSVSRDYVKELLLQEDLIDLVIPRGGEGLIRFVAEHSRIPVLRHYKGVCHVYVHKDADPKMAESIVVNAKAQRPSVCNAAETVLVDRDVAATVVPALVGKLQNVGVEVRGDQATKELASSVTAATEEDWGAEYLSLVVSMAVVDGFDQAIEHIARYGSNHTESIITENSEVAERFISSVHSSSIMVNASTRFADGGELGLGAEIGISTTKLHAYGPMGIEGLTTLKFVVRGDGQIRK